MRIETGARPDCPHPERWTAPDEYASEHAVSDFMVGLVHLLKPDVVVETGAYLGDTSRAIGIALAEEGVGHLYALEIVSERAGVAAQATAGLPVTVIRASSLDWEPPAPIDLLFLDTEFAIRSLEVRRFRAWASPRCVLVMHDTENGQLRGVLDQLAREGETTRWVTLPTPRGLGIARYRR